MNEGYWTNRLGRRRLLKGAAVAGGGLAGAVLIGCGTDEDDGNGSNGNGGDATPGGDSTPDGQSASGEPKRGGHLSFDIGGDPPNFDMHANSTYLVASGISPLYSTLVQYDPAIPTEPPEAVIPDLAESWEQSEDGLTYTFSLVQNAKYANGQSFTAADAKASMERIINPPEGVVSVRRDQFDPVDNIEAPDDYTLVFNMSRPAPSFIPLLAQGWNVVYSSEDIGNDVDFQREINGTGPFRLQNYQRGNRIELVRNEEYHHDGLPYLDAFTIYIIPDTSTALASFQSGELLVLRAPLPSDFETLEASMGDSVVLDGPQPGHSVDTINFGQRDPWGDIRVRRAVSMSIDREAAIALVEEGQGYTGGYMMPGGTWALPEEEILQVPGFEPRTEETIAEARALLDAAGVADGYETTILTRQGATFEKLSLFIKDQLTSIGIDATPQVLESAAAYDALNTRNFDLAPWSHGYATDDPDALFAEFYIQGAPRNYSEIGSDEVDDLFLQQSSELDPEARQELVHEMERKALELYGKVITNWGGVREARHQQVKGRMRHAGQYNNFKWDHVWLDV